MVSRERLRARQWRNHYCFPTATNSILKSILKLTITRNPVLNMWVTFSGHPGYVQSTMAFSGQAADKNIYRSWLDLSFDARCGMRSYRSLRYDPQNVISDCDVTRWKCTIYIFGFVTPDIKSFIPYSTPYSKTRNFATMDNPRGP